MPYLRQCVFTILAMVVILPLLVVCSGLGAATAEPRIALVIGNSSYRDAPLKNPVNDANLVAASLSPHRYPSSASTLRSLRTLR
jgi:hypothetical protein